VQGGSLGLVQRRQDRLVGVGHRDVETGDELDAVRRRVDAFTALVAAFGAPFDESAAFQPLQEAGHTCRTGAGHLCDVALDRTRVLSQEAERKSLLVAQFASPDPVFGDLALSPSDPADQLEAAGVRRRVLRSVHS
jgi:hypothetical protein